MLTPMHGLMTSLARGVGRFHPGLISDLGLWLSSESTDNFNTAEDTNLALTKTYTKSHEPSGSFPDPTGTKFTDGVLADSWGWSFGYQSGNLGVGAEEIGALDIVLDLGSIRDINRVSVRTGGGTPTYAADTLEVLTSEDGVFFTSRGLASIVAAFVHEIAFELAQARYVQYHMTKQFGLAGNDWLFISEGYVYSGTSGGPITTSDTVSLWKNLSGHTGRDLAQANELARPIYIADSVGGKPAVRFDGFYHCMSSLWVPPLGGAPRTFMGVIANVGVRSSSYEHVFHYGTGVNFGAYGLTTRSGGALCVGNHYWGAGLLSDYRGEAAPFAFCLYYDGLHDRLRINGAQRAELEVLLGTGDVNSFQLGQRIYGGENGAFDLTELVGYERELTTDEMQRVEAYLIQKWGVTA